MRPFYFNGCILYVDDILVHSNGTRQEHWELLGNLGDLTKADARVKIEKLVLCQQEVTFLGEQVSRRGWSIGRKFLKAMSKALKPDSIKSLSSFLA